ncbi:isocitrate lyase/phosphoenolpyruvate mutase family protein [Bradyrhizobium sp. B117]|uniref:isocitrate lyase/phosphoenolpyruvate mutase family protein n=1 Tax=Bradyrhizobium sp. B117 TaxID=3140246 RepID=UPI0031839CB7
MAIDIRSRKSTNSPAVCARKDALAEDFVLVTRIEALIGGKGMDQAMMRAYADAGADAILIHSRGVPQRSLRLDALGKNIPSRPTKYHQAPISVYRKACISTLIWADRSMRAAMRQVCRRIMTEENTASIVPRIATLDEVFELLRCDEVARAEARYLTGQRCGAFHSNGGIDFVGG